MPCRATNVYFQQGGLTEYAIDAVLSRCEENLLEAASLGMVEDSELEERLERLPAHPLDGTHTRVCGEHVLALVFHSRRCS